MEEDGLMRFPDVVLSGGPGEVSSYQVWPPPQRGWRPVLKALYHYVKFRFDTARSGVITVRRVVVVNSEKEGWVPTDCDWECSCGHGGTYWGGYHGCYSFLGEYVKPLKCMSCGATLSFDLKEFKGPVNAYDRNGAGKMIILKNNEAIVAVAAALAKVKGGTSDV
tara:strand:+ start:19571 stop:20065 length:495 start_codon:yes stop_codon:yes gene_type:complete